MSLFSNIQSFFNSWLFGGVNPGDVLIKLDGDLLNLVITTETMTNILSVVLVGLLLWMAWFVASWFIKFIFGLFGGAK